MLVDTTQLTMTRRTLLAAGAATAALAVSGCGGASAAGTVSRQDVTFKSEGVDCSAWLFLPAGAGPFPAVVMAHGLAMVKEAYIEPFAQAFAEAGMAVMLFDYRFWGASGGAPRGFIDPAAQMEDYRNALSWLSLNDKIDANRLGIWGTSFSGGHVLQVAAYDPRVKAVVSQVGAVDPYGQRSCRCRRKRSLVCGRSAVRIARAATRGGRNLHARIGHFRQSRLPGTHCRHGVVQLVRSGPVNNGPRADQSGHHLVLEHILEHSPALTASRVSVPALVILAKDDKITPSNLIRDAYAQLAGPKQLLELDGGHYTVYTGPGKPPPRRQRPLGLARTSAYRQPSVKVCERPACAALRRPRYDR